MRCPNCGNLANGPVCTVCGNMLQRKKKAGLVAAAVVLALVTAAAVVLLFVLPGSTNILSTAQNYVAGAYYTNSVAGGTGAYASVSDYQQDLQKAMDACKAVSGGALDFLAFEPQLVRTAYAAEATGSLTTDAGQGYTGGYTSGAKTKIDAITADMKSDADIALKALEYINDTVSAGAGQAEIDEAAGEARSMLDLADSASVVMGSVRVSMSGIETLTGVNAAFNGADIVIDGSTLYLGENGTVRFSANGLGNAVAVLDSQRQSGVVLETGQAADALDADKLVLISTQDMGDFEVSVFGADQQAEFELAAGQPADSGDMNGMDETQPTAASNFGSGVLIDIEPFEGTWYYKEAVLNPFVEMDAQQLGVAEMTRDMNDKPREILMYEGKSVDQYLIFKTDGTGIIYWNVQDVGVYTPTTIWWRRQNSFEGYFEIVLVEVDFGTGYQMEWTDQLRDMMARFQNGDDSVFSDQAVFKTFVLRAEGEGWTGNPQLYEYLDGSADSDVYIIHEKISDDTNF